MTSLFGPVLDACIFAEQEHRGEYRDPLEAGVPYIEHPLAVALLLANTDYGQSDVVLCAALLHDVVESAMKRAEADDHGCSPWKIAAEPLLWKISERFGAAVSDVVYALTDEPVPRAERRLRQERRVYDNVAAVVKIADKTCNVRDFARTRCRPVAELAEYLEHAERVVRTSCRIADRDSVLVAAWNLAREELATAIEALDAPKHIR